MLMAGRPFTDLILSGECGLVWTCEKVLRCSQTVDADCESGTGEKQVPL